MVPKQNYTETSPQSVKFPTIIKLAHMAEISFFTCNIGIRSLLPVLQNSVVSNECGKVTALQKSCNALEINFLFVYQKQNIYI